MAFVPRTRDQIRDSISSNWRARYAANGRVLNTARGSEAYMLADALAVELENLEAAAAVMTLGILPDQADTDTLNRHGAVDGVTRKVATAAVLLVRITGTNGSYDLTGRTLTSPSGLTYAPTVASLSPTIAGGFSLIYVTCTSTGENGNLTANTVLSWNAAPSGIDPTATADATAPVFTSGQNEEDDPTYATRIIARRRDRPASGNRADVVRWVTEFAGVETAYVYPLLQPPSTFPGAGTPETLGCWTAVAMGPISVDADGVQNGDNPVNTRIIGGFAGYPLENIRLYIEGLATSDGTAITDGRGTQLRPVTMSADDFSVEACSVATQDVEAKLTLNAANAFPWSGTMTVVGTSTSISLVVTGDQTAQNGKSALVLVGTSLIRGGYQKITLGVGVFSGGNTTWVVSLLGTPSGTVHPAPVNWQPLRLAAFRFMDSLGPGDVTPAARWPYEDNSERATLYQSALAAALLAVSGVLSATISSPGTNVIPAGKTIVDLGTFLVTA